MKLLMVVCMLVCTNVFADDFYRKTDSDNDRVKALLPTLSSKSVEHIYSKYGLIGDGSFEFVVRGELFRNQKNAIIMTSIGAGMVFVSSFLLAIAYHPDPVYGSCYDYVDVEYGPCHYKTQPAYAVTGFVAMFASTALVPVGIVKLIQSRKRLRFLGYH